MRCREVLALIMCSVSFFLTIVHIVQVTLTPLPNLAHMHAYYDADADDATTSP